jgi:short-subunit dehydrogenase
MSKHAVEAYTDSLAAEMARVGVAVSVIEPGNYKSDIGKSLLKRMQDRGYSAEGSLFEEELKGFMKRAAEESSDKEPDEVADATLHALFDDNPKRRYMVVPNERQADITIAKAIEELVQLNERQTYTYTREQLIAKLDAALAALEK